MDNVNYIIFICIMVPLAMMLMILERKARVIITFMMVGITVCLFISEVNGLLMEVLGADMYYVTTAITPMTEELIKTLPILYYARFFTNDRESLVTASIAVGIGFAVLENMCILVGNAGNVSLLWALVRGFGSGMMHGLCTMFIGLMLATVCKKKKLFISSVFALWATAVVYHAIYNVLVQSDYKNAGFLLPTATFIPLAFIRLRQRRRDRERIRNENSGC